MLWQRWDDQNPIMQKKKSVNVRVEDALYERIRSYAAQHQMSMTEVVLLGLNMILSDPE